MEPLLISRFRLNHDSFRSSAKEQLRTPILLNYSFGCILLAVAIYLAVVWLRSTPQELRLLYRPAACLAIAVFLFFQAATLEKRVVNHNVKVIEEKTGVLDSDLILRFYPEFFESDNSVLCTPTRRAYEDVVDVLRTKSWIVVNLQGVGQFSVDPARFEKGTEADFWKLMNEKCPKAVPGKYRRS